MKKKIARLYIYLASSVLSGFTLYFFSQHIVETLVAILIVVLIISIFWAVDNFYDN